MTDMNDVDRRMHDLAYRFLDAFKAIESHLRRIVSDEGDLDFTTLLRRSSARDGSVRPFEQSLKEFAKLRNSLSHERYQGGRPVAAPLIETVERIESIRRSLLKPPTVAGFARSEVVTATPDQRITVPLGRMRQYDYSQVPVIMDDGSIELLTTNAIARWLADRLAEDDLVIGTDATVEVVLSAKEDFERAQLIPRSMELSRALSILRKPNGPIALIITQSAKQREAVLGVIVAADVTKILVELGLIE